jgi:enamine deaminase RidA (YjgF/YER057c/UK114 family)
MIIPGSNYRNIGIGREKGEAVAEGQVASRLAAINCLAVLKSCLDSWDSLVQIVKITGYIQSEQDFHDQALVLNISTLS